MFDEATHTDILIKYPQIKGMDLPEIELEVNALLKEKAISIFDGNASKGLSLEMETKIEFFNSNLISVKYSGYGQYYDAMSVNDIMYATNIDLKTAKLINVQDLFSDFQEMLNHDVFMYSGADKASDGEAIESNTHEYGYINADKSIITEMFNEYYNKLTSEKYYFSDEYFNIIVKVPSGQTAYLELAANYNDLKNYMKLDNKLWDAILKSR